MGKKLIIKNTNNHCDFEGLFPNEEFARISIDIYQSQNINENIARIIECILPDYLINYPSKYRGGCTDFTAISRVTLLTVLSLYIDRLYRINAILDICSDIDTVAGANNTFNNAKDCIELSSLSANSFNFNQEVICDISRIFNLKEVKEEARYCEELNAKSYKNNMFYLKKPNKVKTLIRLLKLNFSKYTGKIGSFELTQTLIPSVERNLFGFGRLSFVDFEEYTIKPNTLSGIDCATRNIFIKTIIHKNATEIKNILDNLGLKLKQEILIENLIDFLIKYIPVSSIELFQNYYEKYYKLIKNKKYTAIYSTSFAQGVDGLAIISAAKQNKIPSIGSQHGGHHGYIENHIIGKECEYKIVDYYVLWGWKNFSNGIINQNKILNLPSPWYSERLLEWESLEGQKYLYGKNKKYDFIFMPNKIYPFCPTPTGGHLTGNYLNSYCIFFTDLISDFGKKNIKILHKAYGENTLNVMPKTINLLKEKYPCSFHNENNLEKGISIDLIKRGNALLWEQPGTGFLECLVLGIPTFVIWSNIYNKSERNSKSFFDDLENLGIVHYSTSTLIKSYHDFSIDKKKWWEDDLRQKAIKKFINYYARTDINWAEIWKMNFIERFQHG